MLATGCILTNPSFEDPKYNVVFSIICSCLPAILPCATVCVPHLVVFLTHKGNFWLGKHTEIWTP